jgi:hypothetical protein
LSRSWPSAPRATSSSSLMTRSSRHLRRAKQSREASEARLVRRAAISTVVALVVLWAIVAPLAWQMAKPHEHGGHRRHGGRHGGHDQPTEPAPRSRIPAQRTSASVIDLENARCPQCGAAATADAFVDWRGVRVHLNGDACVGPFLADPERALQSIHVAWRDAVRLAALLSDADGDERAQLLTDVKRRWHLVGARNVSPPR